MKRFCVIAAAVLLIAMAANVNAALFTFEGVSGNDISSYMTGVYGSQVTVTDAQVRRENSLFPEWKRGDNYIWTNGGATDGDMEIVFSTPISSLKGDAHVFDYTSGYDFTVKYYGAGYGNAETPNASAFLGGQSWDWSLFDWQPGTFSITSTNPVYLVVFSDNGTHDIGVDNLEVTAASEAVPEPASIVVWSLFGLVGLVFGWRRRKA